MHLVQINYQRERPQTEPEQLEHLVSAAERIAGVAGLQWKIWIYDDDHMTAGGIYLFDDAEHARAFGETAPRSLGHLPGVTGIDIRLFDVDEQLSAIDRAPLGNLSPAPERSAT